MKKYIVTLSKEEREALGALTSKGKHQSQKILNALILLGCDEGAYQMKRSTNEVMASALNISMRKINRVKKRFVEEGIEIALNERKGIRTYAKKSDGDFESRLVALSCSEPPVGFARWSLRLLADRVAELGYIDSVSHETIRRILKKRNQALAMKRMGNSTGAKWRQCLQIWKWCWMFTSVRLIHDILSCGCRLFSVLYGYFNTPTPTIESSQKEMNIRCTKTFSEEH